MKLKSLIFRLLLSCFCCFIVSYSNAQVLGIKPGFNMHFTTPNGLNYVVDRYNETRSFLEEDMQHFNNLDGFTYGIFFAAKPLLLEVGFDHRSQTRSATGFNNSNILTQRDLRIVINTLNLGLGLGDWLIQDKALIKFGGRINLGGIRVRTRVGTEENIKDEEWDDVNSGLYMDFDIGVKIITKYFWIEPYYTISPKNFTDVSDVNAAINPNTYQDDPAVIPLEANGFGLRLAFSLSSLSFDM